MEYLGAGLNPIKTARSHFRGFKVAAIVTNTCKSRVFTGDWVRYSPAAGSNIMLRAFLDGPVH